MTLVDHKEPFVLFKEWLEGAKKDSSIKEPTAMTLSTVNDEGKPSTRIILLKKFDEDGFCFFTNLTSRKGRELKSNSSVSLCFYWGSLGYQIRIEGKVEKVSIKEADNYFASRKRGSQIGAWASKQSEIVENKNALQKRIDQITKDFEGEEIPRPPFWSGFRVKPEMIEFWEEGNFRIHRRALYQKSENNSQWEVSTLYP